MHPEESRIMFEIGEITRIEEIKKADVTRGGSRSRYYRMTIKLLTISPEDDFCIDDMMDLCSDREKGKVYLYAPFFDRAGIPNSADQAEAVVKPEFLMNGSKKWIEINVRIFMRGRNISEKLLQQTINEKLYIGNTEFGYWSGLREDKKTIKEWNKAMPEWCYSDLQNCVQCALATGNHLAFAKFFAEKAKTRKVIAAVILKKYIDNYYVNNPEEKEDDWLEKWKILPSAIWRSLNFEFSVQSLKWNAYIKTQMNKWITGDGPIPDRDVLIQIAICLGLNGEETDTLLRVSGYDRLYLLDAADFFAKIVIDKYTGITGVSEFEKRKEVYERYRAYMNAQVESGLPDSSKVPYVRGYGNKRIEYNLNELETENRSYFEKNWFLS